MVAWLLFAVEKHLSGLCAVDGERVLGEFRQVSAEEG